MFLDIEVFFPRRLEPSAGGNKSVGSVSGGLMCHLFLSSMTLNWMYICLEVSVRSCSCSWFSWFFLECDALWRWCLIGVFPWRCCSIWVALSLIFCCSKPSLMILYMGRSTFPWRRSRWQGARNRLSWFEEAVVLSLPVRHDIKLDVREDGKLLPHIQWFCFSDGVDKICLLSSIVDCDSKGSRRLSITCFGSLLIEANCFCPRRQ